MNGPSTKNGTGTNDIGEIAMWDGTGLRDVVNRNVWFPTPAS